ncbi:hypothetical protein IL54_4415 [Sphingobium sp. ba1]|nr:hypothetical protein IL54_4415 [Sphingobium sp. ba1]
MTTAITIANRPATAAATPIFTVRSAHVFARLGAPLLLPDPAICAAPDTR